MFPSNNREWAPDMKVLPNIALEDSIATVHNIRNTFYRSTKDFDINYETRQYDLNKLDTIDFFVEHLSQRGAAHTCFSFGFDKDYLNVSVEIRRKIGDRFSPWRGLFNQYEITYVLADEKDTVRLRTNHRHHDVYMYPIKTTQERMRKMFMSVTQRVNALHDKPEFYNTIFNNCTTNIARHVNIVNPGKIPLSTKLVFTGYSDKLAYRVGLIDTDLPFYEAKRKALISQKALAAGDDPEFSRIIRS